LLRQVNRQVHGLLLQVNLVASVREGGRGCPSLLPGDKSYVITHFARVVSTPPWRGPYSYLSATIGSTRVARRAGM
jgi:hypothetical protein